MIELPPFLGLVALSLTWLFGASTLCLSVAIGLGALLTQKRPLAGALLVAPFAAPLVVSLSLRAWSLLGLVAGHDPGPIEASVASAVAHTVGTFPFVAGLLGMSVLFYAITVIQTEKKDWLAAGISLVLVVLTAASVVYGGWSVDDLRFAVLRAAIYAGMGGMVSGVALAQSGEETPGREVSVSAAVGFGLMVAAGETSARGLGLLVLVPQIEWQAVELRPLFVAECLKILDVRTTSAWISTGLALTLPIWATVRALMRPGGLGAASAMGWIWLGPCFLSLFLLSAPALEVYGASRPAPPSNAATIPTNPPGEAPAPPTPAAEPTPTETAPGQPSEEPNPG